MFVRRVLTFFVAFEPPHATPVNPNQYMQRDSSIGTRRHVMHFLILAGCPLILGQPTRLAHKTHAYGRRSRQSGSDNPWIGTRPLSPSREYKHAVNQSGNRFPIRIKAWVPSIPRRPHDRSQRIESVWDHEACFRNRNWMARP